MDDLEKTDVNYITHSTTRTLSTLLLTGALVMAAAVLCGCPPIGSSANNGPDIGPQQAYREARARLLQAANSSSPETRSNALEAVSKTLARQEAAVLMDALDDRYVMVQYAGAMGLGEIAYKPAEARLVKMVNDPEVDDRVAAAAIYALHEIGNNDHASMLARILSSPDKWCRAAAATAMGKMGEPSAIRPLRAAKVDETDIVADLAMVEAMAKLGDERSQQSLEGFIRLPLPDMAVKLAAIPAFAETQGRRVDAVLSNLLSKEEHPNVRISAANALAKRGNVTDGNYELVLEALRRPASMLQDYYGQANQAVPEGEPTMLQHLAAMALGNMKRQGAIDSLYPLLDSDSGQVRIASAMAILQILGHDYTPPAESADTGNENALPPSELPAGNLHTSGAIEPE